MGTVFNDKATFTAELVVANTIDGVARADLDIEAGREFPVPLTDLRVHDAFQTVLPNPSATDDLGMYTGTLGTAAPAVKTYDVKTVGATNLYARTLVQLPPEYVAGKSCTIRIHGGMEGAVADTSATVDLVAYRSDEEGGVGSDLVTTAATTINSLTFADVDFTISPGTLNPGDQLDMRIDVAVNDAAGGTSVQAVIGSIKLVCDTRG